MTAFRAYRDNKIRDEAGSADRRTHVGHLIHKGAFVACHSAAPPPVAEYEGWLEQNRSPDPRGKPKVTGEKLRRAVIMIRNGESKTAAARRQHFSASWIDRLPFELAA